VTLEEDAKKNLERTEEKGTSIKCL